MIVGKGNLKKEIHPFCFDCGKNVFEDPQQKDYFMIQRELWDAYGVGKDVLCMSCMEKRLGHTLKKEEIFICKQTVEYNQYTKLILEQ